MDQPLEIHIGKPGGQREGPFSLDEINLALAARKLRSGDYWAWHKGLEEWVPLYDIEGIIKVTSLAVGLAKETPERPNLQEKLPTTAGSIEPGPPAELAPEEPLANLAPPLVQNAEPQPVDTTPESIQAASPEPEPAEPPAPLLANEESELAKDEADEFVNTDPPNENLPEEESPTSSPEAESANSALDDSLSDLAECDPAATEQDTVEALPPAVQEPDEQTMEATTESMASDVAPVESSSEAISDPEPSQPVEPLSADQPSRVSKDEARSLADKAETAATILARLKQSFLHQSSEPANGVTSYFNARRSPLPGVAETGTPQLGAEWGMPEASHPLDFHSKAVPRVPEDGSSPGPETDPAAALLAHQFSSGMPFAALEQLFIFTTGDGRSLWSSPVMSRMLEAIVGENLERIRQGTPRDVIFNCDLSKLLKRDGAISDSVWHAMQIREPTVIERAQKKLSRTCVRTFNVERDIVVALVLFYNIQKLENGSAALGGPSSGTTRFTLPVNAGSSGSEHPR